MYRVFVLYSVSGFISLGYQVAWFRIFMDWFGSTSLTFGLVVANFIGGLGIGALFSKAIVSRLKQTFGLADELRVYGLVELLIGITALGTLVVGVLPSISPSSFPYTLIDGVWELALVPKLLQFGVAILCVLLPCVFMGVTFPLLCQAFLPPVGHGKFPSSLYAWNTLGACSGILACQYFFLPAVGHSMTFAFMCTANIALGAYFMFTGGAAAAEPAPRPINEYDGSDHAVPHHYEILLACAMLSGLLAGSLEGDLFKRLAFLVQLNPGALMTFISFWAILAIFASSAAIRRFGWINLTMIKGGFVIACGYYLLVAQPATVDALIAWIADTVSPLSIPERLPFEFQTALGFPSSLEQLLVLTGCLVFPPFFLVSLLLPFVCNRIHADARHMGYIYGLNTLAFCVGLLLFTMIAPASSIFFSTKMFLVLFVLVTLQFFLIQEKRKLRHWQPIALGLIFAGAWAVVPSDLDLSYFHPASPTANSRVTAVMADANTTTHVAHQDERSKILYFGRLNMTATNQSAQAYMRLMAHVPLLAQEDPQRALLIAFGAGNTASAIGSHRSIKAIDIVDLNRNVFATAPEFSYWNDGIIEDRRVRLIHDDGRHFLRATDSLYDLITSEPPPPMAAGVYRLYSRQYYEAALAHLTPAGMMSQWLPTYQMPTQAVSLAIRTFIEVFPHAALITGYNNNFILIGGRQPLYLARIERRLQGDIAITADLRRASIADDVGVFGRLIGGRAQLERQFGPGRVISDQHNDLENMFLDAAYPPGLSYDPRSILADFAIDKLENANELTGVLNHLGRLRFRVAGFPFESLARVPDDAKESVSGVGADWLRIRLLDDEIIRAGFLRQFDRAAALTEEALRVYPEQPEMLFRLARSELQSHDYEAAKQLLRQFVALEPANVDGRYLLGVSLNRSGDSADALAQFRKVADLRPNWHQPYNDMAWILATHRDSAIRDAQEAIELAERAVSLAPRRDSNLLDTLAAAYAAAERYETARDTIKEALGTLDPARDARQMELLTSRLDQYAADTPLFLPADD